MATSKTKSAKAEKLTSDWSCYRRLVCDNYLVQSPLEFIFYPQLLLLSEAWVIKSKNVVLIHSKTTNSMQVSYYYRSRYHKHILELEKRKRCYLGVATRHGELRVIDKCLNSDCHIRKEAELRCSIEVSVGGFEND